MNLNGIVEHPRRKYWTNRDSGNRLVLPLFITPPKDQQPILM